MKLRPSFAPAVVITGLVLMATIGQADVVTDWDDAMLAAFAAQGSAATPPDNSRTLGMTSAAVFDAVNSISRNNSPYLGYYGAGTPASQEAAAAQAAHDVLVTIYSGNTARVQAFDNLLNTHLSAIADGEVKTNGIAIGQASALGMLNARANDGSGASSTYSPATPAVAGHWQPTGGSGAWGSGTGTFIRSEWGFVTPFTMASGSAFRPAPPPDLGSPAYATAVNEVQSIGSATSITRTADQTQIAQFWIDGPTTASPPGHWNRIAKTISDSQNLNLEQNARLFALLNLAEADTAIATWEAKRTYDVWRPISAIRNANAAANAGITEDANWSPLIPTPSFPAYTSGHSAFSAAGAEILREYFGTDAISFTTYSENPALAGVTRSYTSLSQAADEAGMSRIYGGIHFSFDNTAGQIVGTDVAQNVFNNFLQPVPEPSGAFLVLVAALALLKIRRL